MKRWTLLTFAFFLALPGMARAQEEAQKEKPAGHQMGEMAREGDNAAMHAVMVEKATAAIHEGDAAWADGFNTADADALADLYTEDAMLMPPGAAALEGRAAIREGVAGMLEAVGGAQIALETKDVDLMMAPGMGHMAAARGTWTMTGADGAHLDHGKFLVLWQQTDDGWKISRDIWNSDMAPKS